MTSMLIVADTSQQTIDLSGTDTQDKNLYFGFTDSDGLPVIFDNLSFGLSLHRDGETLVEESFPQGGITYESTNQEFLVTVDLRVMRLGVSYALNVWVENAGARWEASFDVTLPRWPQPYPSWVWLEESDSWRAPIPYPTDGANYVWDEEEESWVVIS